MVEFCEPGPVWTWNMLDTTGRCKWMGHEYVAWHMGERDSWRLTVDGRIAHLPLMSWADLDMVVRLGQDVLRPR